jgi:DNA-binding transcriptional regulator YiaG
MPNIQLLLKAETARVARKEVRTELAPLQKTIAGYRRQIAALKQQLVALERVVKRHAKSSSSTTELHGAGGEAAHRFSATGVKRHRERLGLSAAQVGQLLGVSALSIYNWESGKTRPRVAQIEKLAQLRTMGKREASAKLDELAAPQRSARKSSRAA